ncbi:MAG: ABC transporter substrate-binding protein, partial [Vicinamibacteria bacterium]
ILKEDFGKYGIEMKINQYEWAVFVKNLDDRNFDAATLGWRLGVESDPYQIWHSSQVEEGSNFVGFKSREADELIEKAREEFDRGKRQALYHRFHRILHEEQPYTFLFCSPSLVAIDRRFENVKIYPLGPDPVEWKLSAGLAEGA